MKIGKNKSMFKKEVEISEWVQKMKFELLGGRLGQRLFFLHF